MLFNDIMDAKLHNDIESNKLMNAMVKKATSDPNNLLNDPILNRAIATDPSVNQAIIDHPSIFKPKKDLLIEQGKHSLYNNDTYDKSIYDQYIDGSLDKELFTQFLETQINNPNLNAKGLFKSDDFWLEDPAVLFRNDNYTKIIPTKSMSRIESLNALTRFFCYVLVLLLLFSDKQNYQYVIITGLLIIVGLYYTQKKDTENEKHQKICRPDKCNQVEVCQRPTKDNPFMNVTMYDLMENKSRPHGCSVTDKDIAKEIDGFFYDNLFTNVDDLFQRNSAQRQFYTTPSTTVPNDQTGFAKWLYNTPDTCKENNANCLRYEDIRYNRFNPNIDRSARVKETEF